MSQEKTTLNDKTVDWLYERFQAISKAHNSYLYLLLFVSVFSFVTFASSDVNPHVSILSVAVDRALVLSGCALLGSWLIVAYCGNYDMGEATLSRLADELSCEYEDLEFVDTHSNLFDYAKYARPERALRRGVVSRCSVQLLYPTALLLAWCWFSYISLMELIDSGGLWAAKVICLVAAITVFVAFRRLSDFIGRRWRTFLIAERA